MTIEGIQASQLRSPWCWTEGTQMRLNTPAALIGISCFSLCAPTEKRAETSSLNNTVSLSAPDLSHVLAQIAHCEES